MAFSADGRENNWTTPAKRPDGELYDRPKDDTVAFIKGYEDGHNSLPFMWEGTKIEITQYREGYELGESDREEVERSGDSNA